VDLRARPAAGVYRCGVDDDRIQHLSRVRVR
jgi:hypothetical protein